MDVYISVITNNKSFHSFSCQEKIVDILQYFQNDDRNAYELKSYVEFWFV